MQRLQDISSLPKQVPFSPTNIKSSLTYDEVLTLATIYLLTSVLVLRLYHVVGPLLFAIRKIPLQTFLRIFLIKIVSVLAIQTSTTKIANKAVSGLTTSCNCYLMMYNDTKIKVFVLD